MTELCEKAVSAIVWGWSQPLGRLGLIAFGIILVGGLVVDIYDWSNKYKINARKDET